jgi:hypothetical protein
VPEKIVRIAREMYERSQTIVRTEEGQSDRFEVRVGLNQGSTLSPFLFITVMDELTKEMRNQERWELFFADDIAIVADTEEELQARMGQWQITLERQGMKINAQKTEVMACCKEGGRLMHVKDGNEKELKQVATFRYLGSTLEETGGYEREVTERVRAAWNKWKEVKGVLCDKRMPRRVKIKVYKTVIRPVMMYGVETWALRKRDEHLLERTEMRMLRWMLGTSL